MGRKPIPANLKRDERVTVLFTTKEREFVEEKALESGHPTVSDFVRSLTLQGFIRQK